MGDEQCLACSLTAGEITLPGGRIGERGRWVIEPTIGPLPIGTLIVKPFRHCESLGSLTNEEAEELGPLLRDMTATITAVTGCDQAYVCLWSHADWVPGHIHFVLQPAWNSQRLEHDRPGPFLQTELFDADSYPAPGDIERLAARVRMTLEASS